MFDAAEVQAPSHEHVEHDNEQQVRKIGVIEIPVKRIMDLAGVLVLLALLAPAMVIIAVTLWRNGSSVIFGHKRVGRNGDPFLCLKFRTMVPNGDEALRHHLAKNPKAAAEWALRRKLTQDPRVTRVGAFLRKTSLDELPQLFNVLRGEMSLVGPRPVVKAELLEHYGVSGTAAYLSTRPGLTGLWQIGGRSDTTYEERVSKDIEYVRNWSLIGDIMILLRTVPAVLLRRGAV